MISLREIKFLVSGRLKAFAAVLLIATVTTAAQAAQRVSEASTARLTAQLSTQLTAQLIVGESVPAYKAIALKGLGPEGGTVDVKLLKDGTTVTMARAHINTQGQWQVSLAQQPPGGPYQFLISDGEQTQYLHDIYVGNAEPSMRNPKGDIILSTRLSDNMLLQPGEKINVGGLAEPGRTVDIKLIKEQETYTMARVQAGSNGLWHVTMPGQKAGGPFKLTVTDSTHFKTVNGIIIGHADVKKVTPVKPDVGVAKADAKNNVILRANPRATADKASTQGIEKVSLDNASTTGEPAATVSDGALANKPKRPVEPLQSVAMDKEEAKPVLPSPSTSRSTPPSTSTPVKSEWLQPQFDDSQWPLMNLASMEGAATGETLIARKHVHFAIDPEVVSLSVGKANQIKHIYINGKALNSQDWQYNPLKIAIPSELFRSGDNVIALVSHQQWDNTQLIGKSARFNLNIDQFSLELSSNWSIFQAGK
ncbi:hypothetical protein Patl_3540 [Paraglaciecola sp. T6c]|uniref:hemoblobin-interacting domain-containing protein n=1 Tax=Pseudoalteromonas atlantica (strain T6c / ATCC BAA-1087) TaxID=3042615 RepID=UPI00005C686A|nr:hemoblobin-interacting domain-containing protein [Paraglaciecola sp. T6c]ABG42042.1 hypothetical protein Patl_3540 [Paraglaciecola sp. T6c]